MYIHTIDSAVIKEKTVLVRADFDVDVYEESRRLEVLKPLVAYLTGNKARIILIGHKGRPNGEFQEDLSLRPIAEILRRILGNNIGFIPGIAGEEVKKGVLGLGESEILLLENLRFDGREEENSNELAKELVESTLSQVYVNEAFAASHRKHASIVAITKLLPSLAGFHFAQEVENLGGVLENPKRPVVFIIGGAKEDKLEYLEDFERFADEILIGGRLPLLIQNSEFKIQNGNSKIKIADLNQDKEDITVHSIEAFEAEIAKAGTIIVAGPMGKFEDDGQRLGTTRVITAVANSSAYKIVGGGDTEKVVRELGLGEKFDWISVGGGAALEFLARGTLPGIEVFKT